MKSALYHILLLLSLLALPGAARSASSAGEAADSVAAAGAPGASASEMRVRKRFLPTSRRFDREINKGRFVYKGETMMGLTVSYGTLSSEDADMFPVFENINLKGSVTTINPFVGYFYRNINCFGVRFGYSHLRRQSGGEQRPGSRRTVAGSFERAILVRGVPPLLHRFGREGALRPLCRDGAFVRHGREQLFLQVGRGF